MTTTTNNEINEIKTENAPAPLGHYSQAVTHNGLVYVSGQLPINQLQPDQPIGSITEQTRQTLANLEQVLIAAGSDKTRVLKCTIFISDIALWSEANEEYGRFFGSYRPARSAVPTKDLPKGFQIEIEAIAAI